jgi:hypothetical protein
MKPTRSARVSPMPTIPPQHTLIPASRTFSSVSSRSSKCPRRDDVAIMFGRGVDIVVVIIEPRLGERVGLMRRQHAERHAGFHPHRADALRPSRRARPCRGPWGCATPRPCRSAASHCPWPAPRRLQHRADVHQLGRLEPGCRRDRLRAIAAILRAAAGLDREQAWRAGPRSRRDARGGPRRAEHQFGERQVEQRGDLVAGPVGGARW